MKYWLPTLAIDYQMIVNIPENTILKSQSGEISTPDVNWKYFIDSKINAYRFSACTEANTWPLPSECSLFAWHLCLLSPPSICFTCWLSLLLPSHSCHTLSHYSLLIKKDGISTESTTIKGNFHLSWKIWYSKNTRRLQYLTSNTSILKN